MTSAREAAVACGLPFAEVPPRLPPRELLASLPMQYARRHLVLPLGRGPDSLEVALADPTALAPLDDLRLLYGLRIQPVVIGHRVARDGPGDNTGDAAANKQLSLDRAKAVRDTMIANGVDAARLDYAGFGQERPIASNDTEDGRARNRRTELVVVAK
jgi:hypothetical protein